MRKESKKKEKTKERIYFQKYRIRFIVYALLKIVSSPNKTYRPMKLKESPLFSFDLPLFQLRIVYKKRKDL